MKKGYRRLAAAFLCAVILFSAHGIEEFAGAVRVQAARKDDLKKQNEEDQEKLNDIDDQVDELSGEQEGINEEIQALSDQISEIMASISLLEEEIEEKKAQIEQAKLDLEEAQRVEREQYESMKARIKAMYESGETSYIDIFFNSSYIHNNTL